MQLNESHIESLYQFTRDHFVEYYDLQTELVDHLANSIEAVWEEEPNLSFIEAREKAFKEFGIYGFNDVVIHRERAMTKRYFRYLWRELKQWFSFPKIIITLALSICFYTLLTSRFSEYFIYIFYGILAVWCTYKSFMLNRNFKKKSKASNQKWLLEGLIFKQAGGFGMVFIYYTINLLSNTRSLHQTEYLVIVVSVLLSITCLLAYISLELIPKKSEELLEETYPEYHLQIT